MTPRHHIISITVIILEEKDCTKFLKKIFKKNYEKTYAKKSKISRESVICWRPNLDLTFH